MPPRKPPPPDLTELPLPAGWREFHESTNPQVFRHIQKLETGLDPAINIVLDSGNRNDAGWIHPWTRHGLYRHGVKVLDIRFDMKELYQIWPELKAKPEGLNAWLEAKIENWSCQERARQGRPVGEFQKPKPAGGS